MADPRWIIRTVCLTGILGIPALVMLFKVRRRNRAEMPFSLLLGFGFIATYAVWFLDVLFEVSVMYMVAWPLFGICIALLAIIAGVFRKADRAALMGSNAALLVLAISSIVTPN
jgi:hypothetical protein